MARPSRLIQGEEARGVFVGLEDEQSSEILGGGFWFTMRLRETGLKSARVTHAYREGSGKVQSLGQAPVRHSNVGPGQADDSVLQPRQALQGLGGGHAVPTETESMSMSPCVPEEETLIHSFSSSACTFCETDPFSEPQGWFLVRSRGS
ncbi:hypothetical protein B2J93_9116 [Marssonina coronariae]|uniref:Uncharacterized protein n=1 Tax=Diplocarpon coronariae TaxID=2795749 RepID=A0A218YSY2_9HELO|nr:hypothetical protein B2J93_9116 [Marssonina coronariae]